MFAFASHYYQNQNEKMKFLRAIRQTDGSRTFKLMEGEPYRTSYAKDLYLSLFGK